ncbi:hypothetical protein AC482_01060, partial [miscellaneous Crenarchaeota group-15 archaeon DG-45]
MNRITRSPHPFEHLAVDLKEAGDDELGEIAASLGLGLTLDEMRAIRDHYAAVGRVASDVELQTYDQTWSEHCSHKTFKGVIETPLGTVDGLLGTYIRRVLEELNPAWSVSVF